MSDPEKREIYNKLGEKGLLANNAAHFDVDEFGNAETGCFSNNNEVHRIHPIMHQVDVTLEDLSNGKDIDIHIKRKRFCLPCKGIGASD